MFVLLINGEPLSTRNGDGIRTYQTRENAEKHNKRWKRVYPTALIETAELDFKNKEVHKWLN